MSVDRKLSVEADKFISGLINSKIDFDIIDLPSRRLTISIKDDIRIPTGWLTIQKMKFNKLPVNILSAQNFKIHHDGFRDFTGLSCTMISGDCTFEGSFSSLENLDIDCSKSLLLRSKKLTNLSHISKHVKSCQTLRLFSPIESHLLDALRIENLSVIEIPIHSKFELRLSKAVEIINTYLDTKGDILDCQQELIDAGLKQFAQL